MPALDALKEEIAYYESCQREFLEQFRDRYLLVKEHDVAGAFDTAEDAYVAGLERYGLVPFLVQHVAEPEPVLYSPFVTPVTPNAGL